MQIKDLATLSFSFRSADWVGMAISRTDIENREAARALAGASVPATALALGGDWAIIALAIIVGAHYPDSWTTYMLCCVLIASRQHALLVLMHEGAHGHLLPRPRWNDHLGNLATAWPFLMSLERYRDHHWRHHQFTNTAQDPDWGRKVESPHWTFPKSASRFWLDFIPYFKGLGIRELWFARKAIGVRGTQWKAALPFYVLLAVGLSISGGWGLWVKFWLVPFLTLLPVLMKVRSIVEHLGLPGTHSLNGARNIVGSPVEAFFFGPHGNNLHLMHHLYPQVPWHRLRKLRATLRKGDEFRAQAYENWGYFIPLPGATYFDLVRTDLRASDDVSRAA